jgi:hypothetical protein
MMMMLMIVRLWKVMRDEHRLDVRYLLL